MLAAKTIVSARRAGFAARAAGPLAIRWEAGHVHFAAMSHAATDPIAHLPYALGQPTASARFRVQPEDFLVDEQLEVPEHPTGAHWWLRLRKTRMNTRDAGRALVALSSARMRQLGYAGLKDRHAITTQWFSLPLECLDPERLGPQLPAGLELMEWKRARHAIRRGGLRANHFTLRLRSVRGDREALAQRLAQITSGVPNYFGAQRFGHGGNNLAKARTLLATDHRATPRFERGIYLSAARAWLFNAVLAERVQRANWQQLIPGEAVILHGSRSWFPLEEPAAALEERLQSFDIHPSGPLVGEADRGPEGACLALEQQVLSAEQALAEGLCALRMRAERRALRLIPEQFECAWSEDDLELRFALPSGTFATAVLRELVQLEQTSPVD